MSIYTRLDTINSPDDLKKLPESEMDALAGEIRAFLIENVIKTGGHLASNLGVVELSLALHRQFSTPHDHIIWDVGHQSYVHKILTGRKDLFDTLRTPGGLSGFTKRSESEHDCFGAGHSSTSLSAGLAFAEADAKRGSDAYTIVVLGDGAYTGGMIHEAMNNCKRGLRLIIILNENEMSIAKNIGAFAKYISRVRSSKKYYKTKDAFADAVSKIPFVGKSAVNLMKGTKQTIKNAMYASNYFEQLGLYYMGPVDGNDYSEINDMLEVAKGLKRSTVIHITTKKGKGYRPAEISPCKYHGISPVGSPICEYGFSEAFGASLTKKAEKCKDICAITAAMPDGTGLLEFKGAYPERFYDVGIAEEHAATFAAGLSASGMKPYFAVYSSFLQRAYDNLVHDIALQKLPVCICVDRTGLNTGDGATHHGIFDVSFVSSIPNMEIYSPVTYDTLDKALDMAYKSENPCIVRYPKGAEKPQIKKVFYRSYNGEDLSIRSDFTYSDKPECIVITYGDIVTEALSAKELFADRKINCGIILIEKLKPYIECADEISKLISKKCDTIVFLEEGALNGGAGLCLYEKLRTYRSMEGKRYIIRAIDEDFVLGENGKTLRESAGISAHDVVSAYFDKK